MKRFKKIYIEITNVCNLACSFCPQTKRSPKFMTIHTFNKILEQVSPYTDYIYLHVKGEPLLHPDLEILLDMSECRGLKVNITTNGTLINKVKDKIVSKPSLRQINFSLHSLDKNEMMGQMEVYLDDIFEFTRYALEKSNMIIAFRLWNLEQDNLVNSIDNKNHQIIERVEREFNLSYKIKDKVSAHRGIKLSERVYLNFDYEFKWPETFSDEEDNKGFCYGLKNQAAILVDGTVVPCCLDGEGVINLGNIHDRDFSHIIQGDRAKKIYDGFAKREVVEELCRKCDYRRRFSL